MTTTTTSQRSDPTFLNIIHGSTHFLGPRRQPASSTCCPSTFAHDSEINRVQRQTAFLHGCQPGRTTTQGRQDRRERGMRETSRVHSWNDENQAQSINQSTTATNSLQTAIEQTARLIKLPLVDPRNHVRFEPSSRKTPPVETKGSRRKRKESKETE
ncbi:hypothetical protein BKA81DRAFT_381809 [Phyllosticta paracitricarpa]